MKNFGVCFRHNAMFCLRDYKRCPLCKMDYELLAKELEKMEGEG